MTEDTFTFAMGGHSAAAGTLKRFQLRLPEMSLTLIFVPQATATTSSNHTLYKLEGSLNLFLLDLV